MDDNMTADALTQQVIERLEQCPDPRLRELVGGVIRHVHEFAVEQALTEAELMAGIGFLTEVGQMCTDRRQEFILLSDTVGLSMLVDLINHGAGSTATESTVLGPFYVEGSPWRSNGDAITDDLGAQPLLVSGYVRNTAGLPLPGATVDVWQNATNRLYAVQDDAQSPENLRGRFRTDDDGAFAFRTVRPLDYPIPDDGPVGRMLRATGRHPWRPAHIHFSVFGPAFATRLITQMYFPGDALLPFDPIFNCTTDTQARNRLISLFDWETTVCEQALGYRFDMILSGRDSTPWEKS